MELIAFAFADVWFLSSRALELANMQAALRRPDCPRVPAQPDTSKRVHFSCNKKIQLDVTVRIICFPFIIILWRCTANTYRTRTVKLTQTQAAWPAWQELKIIVWYLLMLYYHCKVAASLMISHSSALSGSKQSTPALESFLRQLHGIVDEVFHDFFNLSLNIVFSV